ncbi:MAG: hypothetical protein K8H88_09735 [Sandaracinaceae bacterium]|nr:hypothetical protein [Sandaracinaceae bacterium]
MLEEDGDLWCRGDMGADELPDWTLFPIRFADYIFDKPNLVGARMDANRVDALVRLNGYEDEWGVFDVPRRYRTMTSSRGISCGLTDSTVACWQLPGLPPWTVRGGFWSGDVLDVSDATDLVSDHGVVCAITQGQLGPCAGRRRESLILRFWQTPEFHETAPDEEDGLVGP